jgi:hypothetical protein
MVTITENRITDDRGYVVYLGADGKEFAHYVFTHEGYARGGSSYPYDKDVTVCFGKLLCIGLPAKKASMHTTNETFTIPYNTPTLVVALEDTFAFTYHKGVGEGKPDKVLGKLKNRINSGENLEELLKQFEINFLVI